MSHTYLALCQRLVRESVGISGSGPTSVLNQTGDLRRVVDWVGSAYEDIQNLHTDWNFLRKTATFNTVADQQDYAPAEAGAADLGEWRRDSFRAWLTAAGVGNEVDLTQYAWEDFRDRYLYGTTRTQRGRPVYMAIKPDRSVALWPIPDDEYTVTAEYFRAPHVMTANADTPIFPAQYHLLVMWRALVFYAGHSAAPETFAVGQQEHKRLLSMLRRAELPATTW